MSKWDRLLRIACVVMNVFVAVAYYGMWRAGKPMPGSALFWPLVAAAWMLSPRNSK